jgi:hypothetical protein
MKKLFVSLLLTIFLLMGCAGMNASVPVNVATDIAFVEILRNNPSYKVPVVAGLQAIKVVLAGELTYDELILQISKQFGGQYAYVGIILTGYIETDKPIFETNLTLFQAYKDGVIKKIDRLLLLTTAV